MSDLTLSLQITALGMGLVFGAILLLWLMMIVLTALTTEKESPAEEQPASASAEVVSTPQADSKLQVALMAVALALAEQETTSARPLTEPPTAIVSAWQLGMRTRQMSEKGHSGRHR
ncbi:MAG: OadG family protein [Anaerolineales bacterium]|nr:OadG family protein [Anaerolineales bacterium]